MFSLRVSRTTFKGLVHCTRSGDAGARKQRAVPIYTSGRLDAGLPGNQWIAAGASERRVCAKLLAAGRRPPMDAVRPSVRDRLSSSGSRSTRPLGTHGNGSAHMSEWRAVHP